MASLQGSSNNCVTNRSLYFIRTGNFSMSRKGRREGGRDPEGGRWQERQSHTYVKSSEQNLSIKHILAVNLICTQVFILLASFSKIHERDWPSYSVHVYVKTVARCQRLNKLPINLQHKSIDGTNENSPHIYQIEIHLHCNQHAVSALAQYRRIDIYYYYGSSSL